MAIDINIESQVSQTITDGVTDKAPSENTVFDALENKVDKVAGKGLSTNDFTNTLKTKLDGIQDGAEVNVNADWNATSGDAEILNKPTIPSVTGLVPYTGAVADVDLGTHKLTAKDLVVNHPSGSGDAATITKGGSGEALKVVKSSGSGNAASITGGVTLLTELDLQTPLADSEISSAATWNAKIGGAVSIGQVAFGTASGVGGDSGFFWDNTNKRFGVGTNTPTARLHVQSQGALSTDIGFLIQNSTGTLALFEHKGDGFFDFVNNANTARLRWLNQNTFQFRFVGQFNLANDVGSMNITAASNISFSSQGSNLTMNQAGCVSIGGAPVGATAGAGVNSLLIANGTAPSANIVDRHYYYSADITAGNAAPHFRTENGSVIKLYKQDLPTNPTNAELATFLSNLGLANLI
jgi:hypothetical protein